MATLMPAKSGQLELGILLEHKRSRLLLAPSGKWVRRRTDARSFSHCAEALRFCIDSNLLEVQLLLTFGDTRYDLRLDPFAQSGEVGVAILEQRKTSPPVLARNRQLRTLQKQLLSQMQQACVQLETSSLGAPPTQGLDRTRGCGGKG